MGRRGYGARLATDPPRQPWIAPVFVTGWILASTCVAIPLLGTLTFAALASGAPAPDPIAALGPAVLAGLTAVQFAAMLLPALVLAGLLPGERPFASAFPVHLRRPGYLAAALVLGFTAGALPSWIATRVGELTGLEMGIDAILLGLADAPLLARVAMIVVVAGVAPVTEELIFRGFLWAAIERSAPTWVAWLVTSVLFGCYHLDPLHVLAVLPLGAVLGWLRWRTESILAPLVLHAVNNTVSLAFALLAPTLFTGLAEAVVCACVAGAVLLVALRAERG